MGYILASATLSKLVLAHDCSDANPETLADAWAGRSQAELPNGVRWFYAAGLGVALLCMSIISMTHVHKKFEGQRIRRRIRLNIRVAVAVILICLPLADGLSSLQLIATTTGLTIFVLMMDVYGQTKVEDSFWKDKVKCKYRAECPMRRRDLERAVKTGVTIDVAELAKRSPGEKGVYGLS